MMNTETNLLSLKPFTALKENQEHDLSSTEIFSHIDNLLSSVTTLIQESEKDMNTLPIANLLLESVATFLRETFHDLPIESVQDFRSAIEDLQGEIFIIAKKLAA